MNSAGTLLVSQFTLPPPTPPRAHQLSINQTTRAQQDGEGEESKLAKETAILRI